jgi:hypothetical protein
MLQKLDLSHPQMLGEAPILLHETDQTDIITGPITSVSNQHSYQRGQFYHLKQITEEVTEVTANSV